VFAIGDLKPHGDTSPFSDYFWCYGRSRRDHDHIRGPGL